MKGNGIIRFSEVIVLNKKNKISKKQMKIRLKRFKKGADNN